MNKRYVFSQAKSEQQELQYKPEPTINFFYQVCLFKNPYDNTHHIRKLTYDQDYKIIGLEEKKYTEKQFAKFTKVHKPNKYKLYSTYDIKLIDYPSMGDIMDCSSSLLNNQDDHFNGFALF